jgi:lipoprotein-anchoring transpeptidase ErfK/SrfK
VSGHSVLSMSGRLWQVAVVTAAGTIGTASYAQAALYYWSESDGGYARPGPPVQPSRQRPQRHQAKKTNAPEKEGSRPQGPLIISISIDKQKLRVYDANGFYAETPISTGMKGHSTPMGVFSVIQKQKLHHSNIYSGAPMPFMQRITWSGIAIHAGVLPGYPASHGCIRMPMAFAMKMWNWTKMGARVVVTPGEMTPSGFSHPLLVAQKVAPQPAVGVDPQADTPPAAKADKASSIDVTAKPVITEAKLELRPTVGHHGVVKSDVSAQPAEPAREPTRTADASNALPATSAPVTMSDAAPTTGNASSRKPEEAAPAETKSVEAKSAEADTADTTEKKTDEAVVVQPSNDTANTAGAPGENVKAVEAKPEAKSDDAKSEDVKADDVRADDVKTGAVIVDTAKPAEKADDQVKPVTDTAAIPAKKDQARPADIEKAAVAKPDPVATPKRSGQISVFVSRKDSKLYVRQNFAPLFEAPVTIAASDRPLGTHVFTAQVDKKDANILHWSVVTLPSPSRYAERRDEDERVLRKRKMTGAVETKPIPVPDSPAEALDRLGIPTEVMARITDALTTGSSIIVSDQGINAGETGEGTDFIVSLR